MTPGSPALLLIVGSVPTGILACTGKPAIGDKLMSATPLKPRLARLAISAVSGAAALLVAACGTSNNANTGQPGTSASPTATSTSSAAKPPPAGKDHVEGLVRSVSGNTIRLTQRDRTAATVGFTPTTLVTEVSSAALTDVTPG